MSLLTEGLLDWMTFQGRFDPNQSVTLSFYKAHHWLTTSSCNRFKFEWHFMASLFQKREHLWRGMNALSCLEGSFMQSVMSKRDTTWPSCCTSLMGVREIFIASHSLELRLKLHGSVGLKVSEVSPHIFISLDTCLSTENFITKEVTAPSRLCPTTAPAFNDE